MKKTAYGTMAFFLLCLLLLHSCGRQGEYPREIGAENPLPIIHPPASLALTHTGAASFCQTRGRASTMDSPLQYSPPSVGNGIRFRGSSWILWP